MSITTEIQRINGGKNAIRTLASQKNVNIPSTALIDSYASVLGAQWPDCTKEVRYDGDKIRGITRRCTNIFDEEMELGQYSTTTGEKTSSNQHIRCKNFIPVSPNTTYYFYCGGVGWHRVFFYDENKNFINVSNAAYNASFTTPQNCFYVTFGMENVYGTVYNHNIAIIQGSTGTYEPYTPNLIYAFYKGTKIGEYDYIDTTNNKLVLGGAEIDISQMSIARFLYGSKCLFHGTNIGQETNTTNIISADYQTAENITKIPDMSVTGNGGKGMDLWFRDDSCTTVEQFKTKNAGKKVYFKLATPTEIDL